MMWIRSGRVHPASAVTTTQLGCSLGLQVLCQIELVARICGDGVVSTMASQHGAGKLGYAWRIGESKKSTTKRRWLSSDEAVFPLLSTKAKAPESGN